MASAIYIQSATGASANSGSTVIVPLNIAPTAGNKLIAVVSGGNGTTFTTPTGWNILTASLASGTQVTSISYWRDADGTEGTSLTFAGSGVNGAMVYEIYGAVLGSAPPAAATSGTTTAVSWGAETPSATGSLAIEVVTPNSGGVAITTPTGYTAETVGYGNGYQIPRGFYLSNAASGVNAAQPATLNTSGQEWVAVIILLNASGVTPPPSIYSSVSSDTFTRADSGVMYGSGAVLSVGANGQWEEVSNQTASIATNQLSFASGAIATNWVRRYLKYENRRDSCVAVYQAANASLISAGAILRSVGLNAGNFGYVAWLDTSSIMHLSTVIAGSNATDLVASTTISGLAPANGFVHLFSAQNLSAGTAILTYQLFYASGTSNVYTGNPASPGTPLQTLTFTDSSTFLSNQAGGCGVAANGAVNFTRVDTYISYTKLLATVPAPFHINQTGVTVTLTGVGTSWTSGTIFTISGGDGASITAQNVTSATAATLTINTGTAVAMLTITDPSTNIGTTVFPGPQQYVMVDIGDSISRVLGANYAGLQNMRLISAASKLNASQPYPREFNGCTILDQSGSTTADYISTGKYYASIMQRMATCSKLDIVVFLLGTNDSSGPIATSAYLANVQEIHDYIMANTPAKFIWFPIMYRYAIVTGGQIAAINAYNAAVRSSLKLVAGRSFLASTNMSYDAFFNPNLFYIGDSPFGLHPQSDGVDVLGSIFADEIDRTVFGLGGGRPKSLIYLHDANGNPYFYIDGYE